MKSLPLPQPEAPDPGLDPEIAREQAFDDTVHMMQTMADWHGTPVQLADQPEVRCDMVALRPDWRQSSLWRMTTPDGVASYSFSTVLADTGGWPTQVTWRFDGATKTATRHSYRLSAGEDEVATETPLDTAQSFDAMQRIMYAHYRRERYDGRLHLTPRGRAATYLFNALRIARMAVGRQP